MLKPIVVPLEKETCVVEARRAGKDVAKSLGMGMADQTRVATAISEIVRNVLQYAGKGVFRVWDDSNDEQVRVRVVVEDQGPGIPDIDRAMQDGFSSGHGLGAGLPGARRLMTLFSLTSRPGQTTVDMTLIRPRLGYQG